MIGWLVLKRKQYFIINVVLRYYELGGSINSHFLILGTILLPICILYLAIENLDCLI